MQTHDLQIHVCFLKPPRSQDVPSASKFQLPTRIIFEVTPSTFDGFDSFTKKKQGLERTMRQLERMIIHDLSVFVRPCLEIILSMFPIVNQSISVGKMSKIH